MTETTEETAYDEVKRLNEVCGLTDAQVWQLVAEIERLRDAGEGLAESLQALVQQAEQDAAENGEDDLIEATPGYDNARRALAEWDGQYHER